MVRILFFAHLREMLGSGESLPYSQDIATVAALRGQLAKRGGVWETLDTTRNLRAAVNQANELIRVQKRHNRESRLVQSTLASLRQLQKVAS